MANTTGKKFGGRKKGTLNKDTKELRNIFVDFLNANIESMQVNFDKLEPKDKLIFIEKFAKIVLPPPVEELHKLSNEQLDLIIKKLENENE